MKLFHFAAAAVLLSAIEAVLVVLGTLPPILAYSPGNVLFSLAKLVIIAYAGMVSAPDGLKKSALDGAALGFAGAAAICIFSLLGSALFGKTVLGLPMSNVIMLAAIIAVILVSNTIMGAVLAGITGVVTARLNKKTTPKKAPRPTRDA